MLLNGTISELFEMTVSTDEDTARFLLSSPVGILESETPLEFQRAMFLKFVKTHF